MMMHCLLCDDLDGLLLDLDLIVNHMRCTHDIHVRTWPDGGIVVIDPDPTFEEVL